MMTILTGGAALTPFRIGAMRNALRAHNLAVSGEPDIAATYVYLLDGAASLDAAELGRLEKLLGAAPGVPAGGFFVMPRKGTISPWSSRAGEALAACGFKGIRRLERAVHMKVSAAGVEVPLAALRPAINELHDRMIEGVYTDIGDTFARRPPAPGRTFDVLSQGRRALETANTEMSLALSDDEIDYLLASYSREGRNPTDTELLMFGQVNSEHCRHKIFNASWRVDGEAQDLSLFKMIKHTHAAHPEGTIVAYADNAGVAAGFDVASLYADASTRRYGFVDDHIDLLMKAETHNHPTAISPFPGASTGAGGEIRDESATGTGGRSRAGLCGFIVSNLRIPGYIMPWERDIAEFPYRLATPLDIMIEGPKGGASFGNDFGRPQLCGFFRTYEDLVAGLHRGYHKPIMMGGGIGAIRRLHVAKKPLPPGALVVQLGGPSMRIGLGGGAASSLDTSGSHEQLDFDSVQRGNAEVQRRCQEVIDACVSLGEQNPILSIHDVGAGGLSNACPELVERTGATFQLRDVPSADPSLSPMEIWCCESQERYVLAILPEDRARFEAICARERCPVAFIGVTRDDRRLVVEDAHFHDRPIDMDVEVLLGKPPRMLRDVTRRQPQLAPLALDGIAVEAALDRVLRLPSVAGKAFLITGADCGAGGLVCRDQMTGPFQLPVADCAVIANGFTAYTGACMATGERTPVALVNGPASGRLAVAEAVTNCAGAAIGPIGRIKLSANWMAACGEPGEDAQLFDTVRAVALSFCPSLGVSIPVGKDSLSMRTVWQDKAGRKHRQTAPLSLIVSAFAAVDDVRKTVTPDLKPGDSKLLLVDLGAGRNRLGGSALAQVYNQVGNESPDCDDPRRLRAFYEAMQEMVTNDLLLAYHDRSDGGVVVTLAEMAISGGRGLTVSLPGAAALAALFSEELGAVLQVAAPQLDAVRAVLRRHGLDALVHEIGAPLNGPDFTVTVGGRTVLRSDIAQLRQVWEQLSHQMQMRRDNPQCAAQEFEAVGHLGLNFKLTYDPDAAPVAISVKEAPRVAVLREQGTNGHLELAAALTLAGFAAIDLHMNDFAANPDALRGVGGLVVGGSGSFGDVFGGGAAWAQRIRSDARLMELFGAFFKRADTFTLGVGNGCQLLARLKEVIPGAKHWPEFAENLSSRFESRYVTVEVVESPSVLLKGMAGSRIPASVAHAEGRALVHGAPLASLRYVDNLGKATERYPLNPDGSSGGLCGFTTADGRATIMMARPERGFRAVQLSYRPQEMFTGEAGPWLRLFRNAFAFAGK